MKDWHIRSDCRLCGCAKLTTVLELAPTPPANEFVRPEDPPQELIPLYLAQCDACGHVQLPVVVDPQRLFANYVYVSGTSPSFVEHFHKYAVECSSMLRKDDLVVDVGSNDGTLLRHFKNLGMRVFGVDPAKAIADQANASGIPTAPAFFTREFAAVVRSTSGAATLVTANNVFAHADDLTEIALGARDLLDSEHGRFVFEVQYLVRLIEDTLFDMVYHEHLSYHSLTPLVPFFDRLGMTLVDAELVDTHGGSIRCTVAPHGGMAVTPRLLKLLAVEAEALQSGCFEDMRRRIRLADEEMIYFLTDAKVNDLRIAGYGAPAKLTTLCHEFGIDADDIAYVVDDSPWKQGLLTPGTRIPVCSALRLKVDVPDAIVIFAWNFADQIAAKLRASGFTGKIIAPLPTYREI